MVRGRATAMGATLVGAERSVDVLSPSCPSPL
jgi:phosphotransacetylase